MMTPGVRLVPALAEHLEVWMEMRADPEARRLMPLEEDTRESLLQRLRKSSSDVGDERATSFRWMVECEGRIVGTVTARELSHAHGRAEVGYMLAAGWRGRGIGTRAMELMLERLFTLPWLERLWLTTGVENLVSQALARKLGFSLEGTLREHFQIAGLRKDQQVWGLLRCEWEARRAAR
jgi:[ribosomal protein S5]-alanine N-acetyltransferase